MKRLVSMLAVLFVGFLFACAGTPTEEPKAGPKTETSDEATDAGDKAKGPKDKESKGKESAEVEAPAEEQESPVSGSGTEGE